LFVIKYKGRSWVKNILGFFLKFAAAFVYTGAKQQLRARAPFLKGKASFLNSLY
jgi:hypothetical protein